MSIRRDTDSGSKKKRMNTTNNEKVLGKEAEASTSERRPSSVQKMKFDGEKEARKYHGRKIKLTDNKLAAPEQAYGCNTCIACLAWPAVVFWPRTKSWSIYCFCSPRRGMDASTKAAAVELWNESNSRAA